MNEGPGRRLDCRVKNVEKRKRKKKRFKGLDEWGEAGGDAEGVFSAKVLGTGESKKGEIAGKAEEFGSIREGS